MIMVAILGVAVPQFSRAMIYLELRKSTQEIAAILRQARSDSVAQSKSNALVLDSKNHVLLAAEDTRAYEWPADIDVEIVAVGNYGLEQDTTIRFYPDGTASDSTLAVSARERSYTIQVNWLTGRVKVL